MLRTYKVLYTLVTMDFNIRVFALLEFSSLVQSNVKLNEKGRFSGMKMQRIKVITISSFHILSASLVYFFTYGISTSLFASKSPNKIFFTLSQIIGSFLGRLLGLFFLSRVSREYHLVVLIGAYFCAGFPILFFPVLPFVGQI